MTTLKVTFLSVLLLLTSLSANAASNGLITEVVHSKQHDLERSAVVKLPESYATEPEKRYPVVYVLDGKTNLELYSGMLNRIRETLATPEFILVSVVTPDRTYDLTPTVNQDPRGPVGAGGGAEKLLSFMDADLIPMINQKYRTIDFKVVTGESIGGLFVLHTLQSRPELFDAHFAFSPAVWWGDRTTAKKTKAFFSKTKSLEGYLYMDIGSESGEVRDVYDDVAEHLKQNKPDNFKLVIDSFPDVPHGLTGATGIFNAFHQLLLPQIMPLSELTNGVASFDTYYALLSQQHGTEITPGDWAIRSLGYQLVERGDLPGAIELFRYNVSLHPELPDALNGLAYGLEQAEEYQEALKQVNLALKYAKEGDGGYEVYLGRQARMKEKLGVN